MDKSTGNPYRSSPKNLRIEKFKLGSLGIYHIFEALYSFLTAKEKVLNTIS